MKTTKVIVLSCILAASLLQAEEPSAADQKWAKAVEQMIVEGKPSISTPSQSRAKLAQKLAKKHGRESKVLKTDTGYRVLLQQRPG